MRFATLFFDLDGTLYPGSNGLWEAIRVRMDDFLHLEMGLPQEDIPHLRRTFYERYGTTLRGLQHHFDVDSDHFLAYVHDLPLEAYLGPDPELRAILESLPQPKWIFTNADRRHAERVLNIVGLERCFQDIIDVRSLGFLCKPDPQVYPLALQIAGGAKSNRSVLFDDAPRNLVAAGDQGFYTVLVGDVDHTPGIDLSLADLHQLPDRLPELWG